MISVAEREPQTAADNPGDLSIFRQQDAIVEALLQESSLLTIGGIDDRKGLELVHDARMKFVKARTSLDKTRKKMNEDARKHIETINGEAKRLLAKIEPEEARLDKMESDVEAEKARFKQAAADAHKAKVKARFDALKAAGFDGDYMAVPELSDEGYAKVLATAQAIQRERDRLAEQQRQHQAAEAERLRKLEAEAAEQARKAAAEVEARRVAEEAAAAAVRRKEQEALAAERARLAEVQKQQEAEAAKLRAEQERVAGEQRKEAERLAEERRKVEMEKARQEAAERARVETEARLKREAAEKEAETIAEVRRLAEKANADEAARLKARQIDEADTIQQAANKVCEHLPAGWTICIELEQGSGGVRLENAGGENVDYPTGDGGFVSDLNDALQHAIELEDPFRDDAVDGSGG